MKLDKQYRLEEMREERKQQVGEKMKAEEIKEKMRGKGNRYRRWISDKDSKRW